MSAELLKDLEARGLVHRSAEPSHAGWPGLAERLAQGPVTVYIGFDPTAASLHVGSLLQILNLVRMQRAGHRPIALVGGGTGLIGDPSFKASERAMLSREQLDVNLAGIRGQLERFLDFSGSNAALMLDNAAWLGELRLLDFLRDVGKHFSVNQMVSRDAVKLRLDGREHGISYTEFSYALLQGYDFLHLFDAHGCELQMGGSDQWGNILDGVDLVRRLRAKPAWGLTAPLVTKSDGAKFGKSETGNVWLDPTLTRPFAFYQFWLNTDDADVARYLRYFTFLPLPRIAELEAAAQQDPARREAQRALAVEVTRLVHGEGAVASAQRASAVLFEGADLRTLSADELQDAFAEAPRSTLSRDALGTPQAQLVAVVAGAGLEPSKGRARAAVEQGAIAVNGQVEKAADRVLAADDLLPGDFVVLRRGKKTYHVVAVG
ncbi:MAG: tyrosine--tRNA ligase [Vicinamibacteria bacterium]|nr:tyrosine--tRNA ligase [Vicinamibacteria bacterium]